MSGKGSRRRPASPEGQRSWDRFWDELRQTANDRERQKRLETNNKQEIPDDTDSKV